MASRGGGVMINLSGAGECVCGWLGEAVGLRLIYSVVVDVVNRFLFGLVVLCFEAIN